jgi:hypothetical protein
VKRKQFDKTMPTTFTALTAKPIIITKDEPKKIEEQKQQVFSPFISLNSTREQKKAQMEQLKKHVQNVMDRRTDAAAAL